MWWVVLFFIPVYTHNVDKQRGENDLLLAEFQPFKRLQCLSFYTYSFYILTVKPPWSGHFLFRGKCEFRDSGNSTLVFLEKTITFTNLTWTAVENRGEWGTLNRPRSICIHISLYFVVFKFRRTWNLMILCNENLRSQSDARNCFLPAVAFLWLK